jgi:hypothetical protein
MKPRFISIQIDRVVFAAVCKSQAIAAYLLARLAQGGTVDVRILAQYGIRVEPGRALDDPASCLSGEIEDEAPFDWGA